MSLGHRWSRPTGPPARQVSGWIDAHGPNIAYTATDVTPSPTERWYGVQELTSIGWGDRTVFVSPDEMPPDQGNAIRAVKEGTGVRLWYGGVASYWWIYRDPSGPTVGTTLLAADSSGTWRDVPGISRSSC